MSNTTTLARNTIVQNPKRKQADRANLKRNLRNHRDKIVSVRTIKSKFIMTDPRNDGDYCYLVARVDRSKRHLDLQEQPPA